MQTSRQGRVVNETWEVTFLHAAGRLGSYYLKAIRDERRVLGWRVDALARVFVPPKNMGLEGIWVDVGPGAVLLSSLRTSRSEPTNQLARVRLDGADTALFAQVAIPEGHPSLAAGTRLRVDFDASSGGGIVLVPDEQVQP